MYARVRGKLGERGFYRDRTGNLAGIVMTRLRNETISTTAKFSAPARRHRRHRRATRNAPRALPRINLPSAFSSRRRSSLLGRDVFRSARVSRGEIAAASVIGRGVACSDVASIMLDLMQRARHRSRPRPA